MIYFITYGDEHNPTVDVILCDTPPTLQPDGSLIFSGEGHPDLLVEADEYLSIQAVHFDGAAAEPEFLYDLRAGAPVGSPSCISAVHEGRLCVP